MKIRNYVVVFSVIITVLGTMVATTYSAPKLDVKKDWNIAFLGTMKVPAELEIVDGKDVITELAKLDKKMGKSHPRENSISNVKTFSLEDITEAFDNNNIGVYQFALKNNGSYNTAIAFAGKVPAKYNVTGLNSFDKLKNTNPQQQEELSKLILKGIDDVYSKVPELQDMFQLEILEFYPFEQLTNKNVQMVSMGGSMAVRTLQLIYPIALKIYILNKNSELYIFGVINSGPDRKMWDEMTKEMLSTARWNGL